MLIIDNTIVMADQLKHRHNFKAFLAILAATLTTISAIVVVFFLPENIRVSLEDFSLVIIINLAISARRRLVPRPALMDKFGISPGKAERLLRLALHPGFRQTFQMAGQNAPSCTSTASSNGKSALSTATGASPFSC